MSDFDAPFIAISKSSSKQPKRRSAVAMILTLRTQGMSKILCLGGCLRDIYKHGFGTYKNIIANKAPLIPGELKINIHIYQVQAPYFINQSLQQKKKTARPKAPSISTGVRKRNLVRTMTVNPTCMPVPGSRVDAWLKSKEHGFDRIERQSSRWLPIS